jgi:alkanesulfonate monooxygenase SsuD/methylene tetrahydromethanopterin reductase-like flavin-dependent oxidoreductase (luciferase family)
MRFGLLLTNQHPPATSAAARFAETLAQHSKPFPAALPMMREICVAETHERALQLARPDLENKYQAYVQWGQHRVLPGDDDMTQAFTALARDRFILGDPAECAAEITRCVEATGATTLLFRLHWPGMPHEIVCQSMRLFAERVRLLLT